MNNQKAEYNGTDPAAEKSAAAEGAAANNFMHYMMDRTVCASPSLRERVESSLTRSFDELRKSEQLAELRHLLDKNPEVARILDLVDALALR